MLFRVRPLQEQYLFPFGVNSRREQPTLRGRASDDQENRLWAGVFLAVRYILHLCDIVCAWGRVWEGVIVPFSEIELPFPFRPNTIQQFLQPLDSPQESGEEMLRVWRRPRDSVYGGGKGVRHLFG